jgi:hypothetical protein
MRKVLLSLVVVLALMTSCKEETTEAVKDGVSDAAAKVNKAIESGATKVEEVAKDVKDDHK